MSTKTFKDLGHEVLDMRTEDAVRSVLSERLRFRKHLASSSIGHIPVAEIQPKHIALLTREMVRKDADDFRGQRKISRVTVQKVMQLASAVFDVAVEQGIRNDNPCLVVRRVKTQPSVEEKWTALAKQEIQDIEACVDIPPLYRAMMLFAIGTGLRQGEQWNLEGRDVHREGDYPHVVVRYGSAGLPPKNGRTREVPLFGVALKAAKTAQFAAGNDRLLFSGSDGNTPRQPGAPCFFDGCLRSAGTTSGTRARPR